MATPLITSRQNQRVKNAVKLRDRRERRQQGRILIDGVREIGRAANAGVEIVEAFVCREMLSTADGVPLVQHLTDVGVPVSHVTSDVFTKLAFGERADGVVAVAIPGPSSLDSFDLSPKPLSPNPVIAVLERVEKPGNIGAVARSADATGVDAMIVADGRTDLFNPNAIRASLGVLFSLPIAEATAEETRIWLRERHIPIYVASPDADRLYTSIDFSAGGAIVLGSEADGVSHRWRCDDAIPVCLPMLGAADSLNISAAAAVLLYEVLRQRGEE